MTADLRGAHIARLTRDWRLSLPPGVAARFAHGPATLIIDHDAPCLVLQPPGDWDEILHSRVRGHVWDIAPVTTRRRLTIPAELRSALLPLGINGGTELRLIGQGSYLEVWASHIWNAALDHLLAAPAPPEP